MGRWRHRSTTGRGPRAPEPWCEDVAVVAERLDTDVARGLTDAQVAERLERAGPNQLEAAEPVPAWRRLAEQFQDPLVYLLLAAVAVSLVAGCSRAERTCRSRSWSSR